MSVVCRMALLLLAVASGCRLISRRFMRSMLWSMAGLRQASSQVQAAKMGKSVVLVGLTGIWRAPVEGASAIRTPATPRPSRPGPGEFYERPYRYYSVPAALAEDVGLQQRGPREPLAGRR